MKKSTAENLQNFLTPRLSSSVMGDVWEAIEDCTSLRDSNGKDDPELAVRLVALLDLLCTDLPADEYERAKKIILETQDSTQALAGDAALRVRAEIQEQRTAQALTRPILGHDMMAMDSADMYRAALRKAGHDMPAGVSTRTARTLYRQMMGQARHSPARKADTAILAQRFGVTPPRRLG